MGFKVINFIFNFILEILIIRTNGPKDPYVHSVLAVTDHPLRELQSELGIDFGQVWGGLKYILNVIQRYPEGSYILLRDPNRVCVILNWGKKERKENAITDLIEKCSCL